MHRIQRQWHYCAPWVLLLLPSLITGQSQEDPWLAERMLEFSITNTATQQKINVRFDGLLVTPTQLADRMNTMPTAIPTLMGNTPVRDRGNNTWQDRGVEDVREAVIRAAEVLLARAADPVYDDMEAEMILDAERGVEGDWLENAHSSDATPVLQRRREIMQIYRNGTLDHNAELCSRQVTGDSSATTGWCEQSPAARVAAKLDLAGTRLLDSMSCILACRAFFDMAEMEYGKAACLRAVRLGGISSEHAMEVDMRLAYMAQLHGQASSAVRLYYGMMGNLGTSDGGRLAMSILGLTMVPPELIGSPQAVTRFRKNWVMGLQTLEKSLATSQEKERLWDPRAQIGSTPFHLAHQGGPDLQLMVSLASVYNAAAPSLRFTAPHCDKGKTRVGEAAFHLEQRPHRIGFFSSYLRDHSIGRMMVLLISHLSENPDLEVHVFLPRNGDWIREDDVIVNALREAAQHWHQTSQDLDEARWAVSQQELDVLVYPDIGMDSLTYFMAFARLATVQCVWWGHPVTVGTGAIDYFLSLDAELDEGQADYLEQMVRMDLMNTAPFRQVRQLTMESPQPPYSDNTAPLAAAETHAATQTPQPILRPHTTAGADRREYDNATATVTPANPSALLCRRSYLVFGRLFKLHYAFDTAIEGILAKDSEGCVVLIHEKRDEAWTRSVWKRLTGKLKPRGLSGRLRIIHHWDYVEALRRATAVLDTFPYGGCLTVLEALSHGVPVVTLPANFIRGRFALAIYEQMGYSGLVADDLEEYVDLAVRIGMDEAFRERARAEIESGYFLSLHRHVESAAEWGEFFRRALRAARY